MKKLTIVLYIKKKSGLNLVIDQDILTMLVH